MNTNTSTAIDTRQELIKSCLAGSRTAQRRLYEEYADAMYNVCYRMLQSHDDAQDALQMAFIKVFKNLGSFNYQSTPGAWIKRIVINQCINHIRANKMITQPIDEQAVTDLSATDEVEIDDYLLDVGRIKRAISMLSDGYRQIVNLYLIEGYDHSEIAAIMDISVSTSKTQYHRAKKKIREHLKAMSDEG